MAKVTTAIQTPSTSMLRSDAQELEPVLDPTNVDDEGWADSAYRSEEIEEQLAREGDESRIHETGDRNHPLSEAQTASNQEQSKTSAKVEPVFGAWVNNMGGQLVRCIGWERVSADVGLKDLTDHLTRHVFWHKRGPLKANRLSVSTVGNQG